MYVVTNEIDNGDKLDGSSLSCKDIQLLICDINS